jgi:hypothetical protein
METHDLFSHYKREKMDRYRKWLNTPHGREVYGLFKQFATKWKEAGNDKCSASLILNRLRWETGIKGRYCGFKVSNDHGPLLARQLIQDNPEFAGFFDLKETASNHLTGKETR